VSRARRLAPGTVKGGRCRQVRMKFEARIPSGAKRRALCFYVLCTLTLCFLLSVPNPPLVAAASDDSVRNFVDRVNDASTALLSSESNATLRCRRLLGRAFDVPGMAATRARKNLRSINERGASSLPSRLRGRDRRSLPSPHESLPRSDNELCRSKTPEWW
jgi:hypothetical protein